MVEGRDHIDRPERGSGFALEGRAAMTYQNAFNPAVTRRNLIAGVAGLGAAGILAGCSSNDGGSGSGSASGAGEFKIGSIGPLTGAAASYGTSVKNGAELG